MKQMMKLTKTVHGMGWLSIGACLLILCSVHVAKAYENPLLNIANDPDVTRFDGAYHMIVGDNGHYDYRTSTDLVHWNGYHEMFQQPAGYGLWEGCQVSGNGKIWMYYTKINTSTQDKWIQVATASTPNSDSWTIEPGFVITPGIDPYLYDMGNGTQYLYYKDPSNGAKNIWVQKLSGYNTKVGSPKLLLSPKNDGVENCNNYASVEGPCVKQYSGKFFLFYSAGAFDNSCYSICYAYSSNPDGPFTRGSNNPLMSHSASPGSLSIGAPNVMSDGGSGVWMAYRQWETPGSGARQFCIDVIDVSQAGSGKITGKASNSLNETDPVPLP